MKLHQSIHICITALALTACDAREKDKSDLVKPAESSAPAGPNNAAQKTDKVAIAPTDNSAKDEIAVLQAEIMERYFLKLDSSVATEGPEYMVDFNNPRLIMKELPISSTDRDLNHIQKHLTIGIGFSAFRMRKPSDEEWSRWIGPGSNEWELLSPMISEMCTLEFQKRDGKWREVRELIKKPSIDDYTGKKLKKESLEPLSRPKYIMPDGKPLKGFGD